MPRRNPPLIPADTSEDVWKRQMKAVAERSIEERLDEWQQLNEAVARMEAEGIRRRHPDYDDHQVLLAAARIRYGDALVLAAWPREPLVDP
ncbi:MAG: hypothetical protein E4H05_08095 [Acidimicrobiales bacterium]|nr:MAG: hypothetical protein E4H05_08095 [Acidimicrobiales bacterium]